MSLNDSSSSLFSFTQSSSFEFYHSGLFKVQIRSIDQKIKQLHIKMTIRKQKSISVYEEVLQQSDFLGISKSHKKENLILSNLLNTNHLDNQNCKKNNIKNNNDFQYESESLLWFKLYLEEYLRKVQAKLRLNKSKREEDHIFNSFFIFADEVYMRKVYKNAGKMLKTLQADTNLHQEPNQTDKKAFFFKIDPSILNYPEIFKNPFLINFPHKLKQQQSIISTVQNNQKMKETAEKEIQNIFFDNKFQ